ncbi:MAG: hypothetical protein FWC43_10165, partial [Planctomycetaceae bacterium]|nr:hypothetical protein [Planctomycetaceae bacterium]
MATSSAIRAGRAFVELFVDNSKLVRGLRAAEKKVVKFGQNIQAIGRQLFTLGAAVGGILAVAAKGFASYGDSLSKMSGRTGVSAQALSELAYAAQQSGTNIETLEASLRTMQKNLSAAFSGNDTAIRTLESLGINVAKLKGMTPEEQFLTLGEAISRVADPTLRTAFAMRVFGKSGSQLLPMLAGGVSGINALRQRCRELGLSVSDLDAANATKLSDALTDLWLTVKAVGFAVGAALAKPLTELTEQMVTCIAGVAKWINMNRDLVVTAAKVTAAVTGIGAALFVTGLGFVGVGKTIGIIATAIASVAKIALGGFSLLSGILKAVAFAAGSVVSVFSVIFSQVGLVFTAVTTIVGTAFSVLATIGTAVFSAIGAAIAAALSPIGLTILALGAVAGACYLVYRNFSVISETISTAFRTVVGAIGGAISAVYRFLAGFTEFKVLFGTIGVVTTAVKMLGRAVFWVANSLIKPTFGMIFGIFLQLGKIVVKSAVTITSVLFSCFRQIFGIARTIFAAVGSVVVSSFYKTVSAVKSILTGIGSLIGRALSPVLGVVGATIRGVVGIISTLSSALRTVAGWIVTFARSFFVVESAVQVFSLVGSAVSRMV